MQRKKRGARRTAETCIVSCSCHSVCRFAASDSKLVVRQRQAIARQAVLQGDIGQLLDESMPEARLCIILGFIAVLSCFVSHTCRRSCSPDECDATAFLLHPRECRSRPEASANPWKKQPGEHTSAVNRLLGNRKSSSSYMYCGQHDPRPPSAPLKAGPKSVHRVT